MKYVVSDIHGCLDNLLELLQKVSFDENKDILYILGDIVDRGPKTWETYLWVKERIGKSVFMILGNHEDMLIADVYTIMGNVIADSGKSPKDEKEMKYLKCAKKNVCAYDQYGTIRLLDSQGHDFGEILDMCEFFETLPLYYEIEEGGKTYTLVHAFCKPEIEKTRKQDIIWERVFAEDPKYFCDGKTVVFGHTPVPLISKGCKVVVNESEDKTSRKFNIDCGCVYGFQLAIMRLGDEKIWYSKLRGGYL